MTVTDRARRNIARARRDFLRERALRDPRTSALKARRLLADLSLSELEARSSVPSNVIVRAEGGGNVTGRSWERLASALDVSRETIDPGYEPPKLTAGELKERYDQKRADEVRRRTSELADDFVMFVKNSRTFPVKRREVVEVLGVSINAFQRAANLAISRGDIVSVRWAGPNVSGYYTPETAPTEHHDLKAAA